MTEATPADTQPIATMDGPVREVDRIATLDVIRGVSLLGILAVNIQMFAMINAAYFNPTAYGDLTGANGWVAALVHIFAHQKFMTIFSMLFGAGIILMTTRAAQCGRPVRRLHYRRMFALLVIGVVHAYLIWHGDVLVWYALTGMLIYGLRTASPRRLLVAGFVALTIGSGLLLAAGLSFSHWSPDAQADYLLDSAPTAEMVADEVAEFRGSYMTVLARRIPLSLQLDTFVFLFWGVWRCIGVMALGMALFKRGFFSGEWSATLYKRFIYAAIIIGVPLVSYEWWLDSRSLWDPVKTFFLYAQINYWLSILMGMGIVSAVMLACRRPWFDGPKRRLAAVGRLALSNYIGQSLIGTLLFYGYGFALFGRIDRVGQMAIVVAICAFQLYASPLWCKYFQFGPLEWLWRYMTYGKRPPFRRLGPLDQP